MKTIPKDVKKNSEVILNKNECKKLIDLLLKKLLNKIDQSEFL